MKKIMQFINEEQYHPYQLSKIKQALDSRYQQRQLLFNNKRVLSLTQHSLPTDNHNQQIKPQTRQIDSQSLQTIMTNLQSDNQLLVYSQLKLLKQIIIIPNNIDIFTSPSMLHQLLPLLLDLTQHKIANIVLLSIACFCNLTSLDFDPSSYQIILESNVIDRTIQMLSFSDLYIAKNAAIVLGNLACTSQTLKDSIIDRNIFKIIHSILMERQPLQKELLAELSITISMLCRGNPIPQTQRVQSGVGILCWIAGSTIIPQQALIECLHAIRYHCTQEMIECIIKSKMIEYILKYKVKQLGNKTIKVFISMLQNLSTGNTKCIQYLISVDILSFLEQQLSSSKVKMNTYILSILGNIVASSSLIAHNIYTQSNFIQLVAQLNKVTKNLRLKYLICRFFSNLITLLKPSMQTNIINQLFSSQDIMTPFIEVLDSSDPEILQESLTMLFNILSQQHNQENCQFLLSKFEQCNGSSVIQQLQYCPTLSVANIATRFLQKYYILDDPIWQIYNNQKQNEEQGQIQIVINEQGQILYSRQKQRQQSE